MQALVSVRGNCRFQRKLVLAIGCIYAAASTFIVGLGFFLAQPKFICRDGKHCDAKDACDEGHYHLDSDSIHSMVYEWKLVCDDGYQTSLIGSLYFIGMTIGSMLIGTLTDSLGRQRTCLICLFLQGTTLILGSFAPSPVYIDIVSVLSGILEALLSVAGYMLLIELLSSDLRGWYSGVAFAFWSSGTVIVSMLFLALNNWRHVMIVCGGVSFSVFPIAFFLPESIRWLIANKHRIEAATQILHRIAAANGIDPATVQLQPLVEDKMQVSTASTLRTGYRGLFSSRKMQVRLFGINFIWITVNICYFGTLICVSTFEGNIYANGVVLGFGEAIPNIVIGLVADKVKRKKVMTWSCVVGCGLCMVAWELSELSCGTACEWTSVGVLLLLMMAIDVFFLLIYIYTAELFPTKVRGAGYAMCSTLCRLGGMAASNMLLLQQQTGVHPLLIIAGTLLVSVLPICTLPETQGQALLDYH